MTPSLVRQIGSLFDGDSVAGLSDRQLLDRFVARRDAAGETAFTALVTRHGPMVLGVCRQLLGDRHHAEDAFQATFLVLARKAGSIRDPDRLGNWLYGVAIRTARKGKARLMRQRRGEDGEATSGAGAGTGTSAAVEPMAPPADQPAIDREQAEVLHDEIDRLPGAFRLPVVLCYFEGLTLDEAARRLRCPAGTVGSRLARARDKLRRGLTRRGVVLPAAALAAVLDSRPASASVSSPLCDITTRAALNFAAGQAASPAATALAQEMLRSMFVNNLRLIAMTLLFLGIVATGAGFVGRALATKGEPRQVPADPRPRMATKPDDANPKPAPGRMFVVGRVLDPQGKPVSGATVMASARARAVGPSSGDELSPDAIGHASSDGSGRFQLDAPRTSSSRYDQLSAVAMAPGYGIGWVELDPDVDRPSADITLPPERVIQDRLVDIQGQAAQGVKVSVWSIRRVLRPAANSTLEHSEGLSYRWARVNDMPAWPRPATTDAEGRFILHGVGRGLRVSVAVIDPRFAMQMIELDTDAAPNTGPLTIALQPARIVTGRLTYADTGKPVPHAPISIAATGVTRRRLSIDFETDADGRFRANPAPGDAVQLLAAPPDGQPYLGAVATFKWSKAEAEHSVDLALSRGVVIRGKITEEDSGKAVAGATVTYVRPARFGPVRGNETPPRPTETRSDGSFQLTIPPHPGRLAILAPSDDYVRQEMSSNLFLQGLPGGMRIYSHAFVACDPKPETAGKELLVSLRRGATITGRVIGPDGQPVPDAWIFSRVILRPWPAAWLYWHLQYHGSVKSGRFEVHGLDPDAEVPVYFLDPRRKLGTTAAFSGKSAAGGPVTVRLEPCGTAQARLVGLDGKPIGGISQPGLISMVVTPGALPTPKSQGLLLSDEGALTQVDPINYQKNPAPDAQGRVTFPALIPGATYRIIDRTLSAGIGPQIRKEFTVRPGEALDLGDVVIEKPQ